MREDFSASFLKQIGLDPKFFRESVSVSNAEELMEKIKEEGGIQGDLLWRQNLFRDTAPDIKKPLEIIVSDGVVFACPSCLSILPSYARLVDDGLCDYCVPY